MAVADPGTAPGRKARRYRRRLRSRIIVSFVLLGFGLTVLFAFLTQEARNRVENHLVEDVLNQNIDDAFERAKPADDEKIPALIWRRGGLVPGEGTLPDELLRWTGFANVSKDYGLAQWDVLTLEHLVNRPPRLLFSDGVRIGSDGQPVMPHPVLEKLSDRITIARYPERLLHCAGPTLIDAVTILSAERRKYKGAL